MENNSSFSEMMKKLGVEINRTPKGWTWHHELESGLMGLVPRTQHSTGSSYWKMLHPEGYGGYAEWGK